MTPPAKVDHPDLRDDRAVPSAHVGIAAPQPRTQAEIRELARWWLITNGLNPNKDDNKELLSRSIVEIMKGMEMGIGAMQSLVSINVKPSVKVDEKTGRKNINSSFIISSHTQRALIFKSGMVAQWDMSDIERENSDGSKSRTGTMLIARRVGMEKGRMFRLFIADFRHMRELEVWRKYPFAMLQARLTVMAVKALFSDILQGVISHDEADEIYGDHGVEAAAVKADSGDESDSALAEEVAAEMTDTEPQDDEAEYADAEEMAAGVPETTAPVVNGSEETDRPLPPPPAKVEATDVPETTPLPPKPEGSADRISGLDDLVALTANTPE